VLLGAFFELVLVATTIGTAVTLYPIVKRQEHRASSATSFDATRLRAEWDVSGTRGVPECDR
jgi:hypothetical protein